MSLRAGILTGISTPTCTSTPTGLGQADNQTDFLGFVCNKHAGCVRQASDLLSVAAPYLQSNGTFQSVFFNLDKLDLADSQSGPITDTGALVNNPGMARALTVGLDFGA